MRLALPNKRVVINLAPASVQKEGSHFDLAIVVAILVEMEIVDKKSVQDKIFMGELSLDGKISQVRGVLPAAIRAVRLGYKLVCPSFNAHECAFLQTEDELQVFCPNTLVEVLEYLRGNLSCYVNVKLLQPLDQTRTSIHTLSVKGHITAKRALQIAACGGHNLLLNGSPGTGKSMLAACFAGLLPSMTKEEFLEVGVLYSMAGIMQKLEDARARPYRAPHHSASTVSIIGGGRTASPGEISLAHYGVLFLDELPEFNRKTLEALRQPLETKEVVIARALPYNFTC